MREVIESVLVVGLVLLCAVSGLANAGQTPARDAAGGPTGTASIRGRVVAADTGASLRRAHVRVSGAGAPELGTVLTDEQGRYEFNGLPAGRYSLTAAKSGYVALSYGQRRPSESGRTVEVSSAQRLGTIDFALPKGGAIVVRVISETGEPMNGITVQAEQSRYVNGERRLVQAATGAGTGAYVRTDHRGEGRLYGLMPGEYYVSAQAGDGGTMIGPAAGGRSYAPTYYPGTSAAREAQPVVVPLGQETSVSLPLVVGRTARVSGTIRGSDGAPLKQPSAVMPYMGGPFTRGVLIRPDGSFESADLAPGDYTITVRPTSADTSATLEYARVPITITGPDVTGLVITTSKGGTFRGRFVFETAVARAVQPGGLQLAGMSVPAQRTLAGSGRANADWTFEIRALLGSAVFRLSSPPSGWLLKAVVVDGRDVTDTPLDFSGDKEIRDAQVILTEKQSEVSGAVVDSGNASLNEYAVVVFPEDRAQWTFYSRFIAAGYPDQQGRFRITGLPAGRYLAAAVDYLETGAERDPELLARLRDTATPVTLDEGESKTVSLRLAP